MTGRCVRRLLPLRGQSGYALTELLTVLVILTIVLGGLTALFVSATRAEVDMQKRFEAQQEARLAMDALRREVHCASARRAADACISPSDSCFAGRDRR